MDCRLGLDGRGELDRTSESTPHLLVARGEDGFTHPLPERRVSGRRLFRELKPLSIEHLREARILDGRLRLLRARHLFTVLPNSCVKHVA